jgi:predicted membrane-bound spermidine synthase
MRTVLSVVAFGSGAVVMTMELAASRIIAPYLGTSVIIWTSLIGVILAALSIGYAVGGRIADRYPRPATLITILLLAAASVATASLFQWILRPLSEFTDLASAAVIGVFLLFGPATFFLGMVTPIAVKLLLHDLEKTGKTVGNLYAISNTGSIVGTFLGGFFLISFFGSSRILAMLALTLLALALLTAVASRVRPSVSLSALAAVMLTGGVLAPGQLVLPTDGTLVADIDTTYSRNWVYDIERDGRTVRILSNVAGGVQSGIYLDNPAEPVFEYIRMYDIFAAFAPDAKRGLMLGGSVYTYPRHFLAGDEERTMTTVEIDPGITEIARTYFQLEDHPRHMIVHDDARIFLNSAEGQYDALFVDTFLDELSIPHHLATVEAVRGMERLLAEGGVVLVNIVTRLDDTHFLAAEYATYNEVFPHVKLYRVQAAGDAVAQNIMLVASREPLEIDTLSPYAALAPLFAEAELEPPAPLPPLTDEFAPVERYTLPLYL